MNTTIIKICKHHGPLTENQVMHYNIKRKATKFKPERLQSQTRCKACNIRTTRSYQTKNPDKTRIWDKNRNQNPKRKIYNKIRNLKKFGFTLEDFEFAMESQNSKCAICNKPETSKQNNGILTRTLAIDHCHKTGKFRALLCSQCNKGIGHFNDSIKLMGQAIKYLRKHQ